MADVLTVPVDGERLHLVEQYRHPVRARCWELPSGGVDAGVDADEDAAAVRELREETGLVAQTLTRLGTLDVTPSTMSQRCHVFLATDLDEGPPGRDPAEVDLRSAWFSRGEVEVRMRDGTLTDAKSLAAFTLFLISGR